MDSDQIEALKQQLPKSVDLLEDGYTWAVDADIKRTLIVIPHGKLIEKSRKAKSVMEE